MSEETQRSLSTPRGNISYALRRSVRRKTMEISISSLAQARVSAPRFVPLETIERFIFSRSDWILQKVAEKKNEAERLAAKSYETGQEFLFMGKFYPLAVDREANASVKISLVDNRWEVRANAGTSQKMIKNKLIAWYRREAGEILGARTFHYSRIMGLTPQKITVKTQQRLWGSCNPHGQSINLNWTLVMAPLAAIDYVVVHELCHLLVPDHSPRFWKKVAGVLPDYKKQAQWLKTYAPQMRLP